MADANPLISWKIEEYVHRKKSSDWFWALGLITVAGAAIAVIFHDSLFAVFIIFSALILGYYAAREPQIIEIKITEEGILVRKYLYSFKTLKGFAIDEHPFGNQLLIESTRLIIPVISVPLPKSIDIDELTAILLPHVPEKEIKEQPTHRLMEHIGF